jgi:ABC-type nickel/cobalt efflux system permease component RcnA
LFGLDEALSGLAAGHGALLVLLVAFLLGLRHASDPDHLVAVSTLVAGTRKRATRAAAILGAMWGTGHALTLLAFGLPVVLVRSYLPNAVEKGAEAMIGIVIVILAARLLWRWRRGAFHLHLHDHDGSQHLHVHSHAVEHGHEHRHIARTPTQAFSIGLLHGTAGSAGVAVLIVAAVPDRLLAVVALVVLAVGTAISMTMLSAGVGRVFALAGARRAFASAIPALGSAGCLFGLWYAAEALRAF